MAKQPTHATVDDYLAALPPETQRVLGELRSLVRETVPGATERISYGIPTFELDGKYVVYLAGWKKHVSLYPITAGVTAALAGEIEPYRGGKGTIQLPLGKAVPLDLVRRIVEVRREEVARRGGRRPRRESDDG